MENSEKKYKILQGSMLDILPTLAENSFDSCITDPPYELNFMGKSWDRSGIAFQKETWEQVYRVLKSGAYLIAFGGSRTFHRIACAIEDAGFEIRDTIMWLYGSGFPKSQNVGLMIDKKLGNKSIDTGIVSPNARPNCSKDNTLFESGTVGKDFTIKKANNKWEGYGTCLKPAYEPIIVARKPIEKTIVENCLKYGCGAINIDECRVPFGNETDNIIGTDAVNTSKCGFWSKDKNNGETQMYKENGRFPSNVILTYDENTEKEVCGGMPYTKGGTNTETGSFGFCFDEGKRDNKPMGVGYADEGNASRYFYCAKASKKDRDSGLELFEEKVVGSISGGETDREEIDDVSKRFRTSKKNIHPTVKPVELMQYLVRMFNPKGANILDCFAGSGSTGKATMFENRERDANYTITMIELTPEYVPIIKARCDYATDKYEYEAKQEEIKRKEKGEISIFDYEYTDW